MTKYAYEVDDTLIAKFRMPLDGKTATIFAAQVIQFPNHVLTLEGGFLVMRFGEES